MSVMQKRSILLLSLEKTWKGFGSPKQKLITVISLILLGAVFGWWIMGVEEVMEELKTIAIWGLAPICALATIMFLWNLLLAPFELLGDRIESAIKDSKKNETPPMALQKTEEPLEKAVPSRWKHVHAFQAWEVAYLCAGFSPIAPDGYQNDAIRARWAQIMEAISSGELKPKATPPGTLTVIRNRRIERKELQRYFKEQGEVPEFLKE